MTQLEAAKSKSISEHERFWITQILVPISKSEAAERAPHLFKPGKTTVDRDGQRVTMRYYLCGWFDEESRLCTNWEDRPETCAGYPFYGEPPDRRAALPPTCSYREDIGQEVVFLTKPPAPASGSAAPPPAC